VNLRPITVSHQFETQAVIAQGIAAGDRVVTTGFSRLKDGASVSVAAPEGPTANAGPAAAAKAEQRIATFRAACGADIQRLCANADGRSAVRACLQANAAELSDACRSAAKGAASPRNGEDANGRKGALRKAEGAGGE
jgi:multidrug efflux system membrane fusion protein